MLSTLKPIGRFVSSSTLKRGLKLLENRARIGVIYFSSSVNKRTSWVQASNTPPHDDQHLTFGYLMGTNQRLEDEMLSAIAPHLHDGVLQANPRSLLFCKNADKEAKAKVSESLLPLVTDASAPKEEFDFDAYTQHLRSSVMGNVMMYAHVSESTMRFLEGPVPYVPRYIGMIAVASVQLHGKGGHGKKFRSPEGTAMFSLDVTVESASNLGRNPNFFQHLGTLALVDAVTDLPGYEGLDLRLRWPQKVVFGHATSYMGGVLATCDTQGDLVHANVGCGLYVKTIPEGKPLDFASVNGLIQHYNRTHGTHLEPLSVEQVIGRTVTIIEELVNLIQTEKGIEEFKQRYYKRWAIRNDRVHVEEKQQDGVIVGLDDHGDLQVFLQDGTTEIVKVGDENRALVMKPDVIGPAPKD